MAENAGQLFDVLVVGAGPTGLTAACELARRGVNLRIIDKLEQANDKSKALVVHARTLELLNAMGCAEGFVKEGFQIGAINVYDGKKRIAHLLLNQIDSPYQYALGVPQYRTERLLYEYLQTFKKDVERSKELVGVIEESDHVKAVVKKTDGSEETILCKYLFACDGAHSAVRHCVKEPYEGGEYQEIFQLADVKVNMGETSAGDLFAFSSGKGNAAFFPMPGNRWRVIVVLPQDAAEPSAAEPTLEEIQTQVDAVAPWKMTLSDPVWLANFKVRYRKVKNYRHGRVFLAGDAAHCHSPVGGQGMNTGMQDAFNLAWKLALASKGNATEELLDSYQFERHAVAEQLLKSVDLMTRVNLLRAPIARELRNRLAPLLINQEPVQARLRNFLSEIGINYRRSPVVAEMKRSLVHAALSARVEDEPRLGDWFEFSHGPHAGDRAPEAHMVDASNGQTIHVSELFKSGKHNLLLITGDSPSAQTYKELCSIADNTMGKYGEFVELSLITCEETPPLDLNFAGSKYTDPDYSVHQRYGAGSPCMYIIRPDAYVGYRSQPAEFDGVEEYFDKIIRS